MQSNHIQLKAEIIDIPLKEIYGHSTLWTFNISIDVDIGEPLWGKIRCYPYRIKKGTMEKIRKGSHIKIYGTLSNAHPYFTGEGKPQVWLMIDAENIHLDKKRS